MSSNMKCQAKNPATCRFHGQHFTSTINFENGTFNSSSLNPSELNKKSKVFELILTNKEKAAIVEYLEQGYTNFNKELYNEQDTYYSSQIKLVDSALAKYEQLNKGEKKIVYRATKMYDASFGSDEDLNEYLKTHYQPGDTITMKGFTSTTTNPEALFDFLTETYKDVAKRYKQTQEEYSSIWEGKDSGLSNIVYEIETPSGAPVSSFGHTYGDKEQEYLLPRNKTFKIVEVIPQTKLNNPNPDARILAHRHATIIRVVEVETNR